VICRVTLMHANRPFQLITLPQIQLPTCRPTHTLPITQPLHSSHLTHRGHALKQSTLLGKLSILRPEPNVVKTDCSKGVRR
jgi:hypothetical protein